MRLTCTSQVQPMGPQFYATAAGLEAVISARGWSWRLRLVTQIHAEHLFLIKHTNKFELKKACVGGDRKLWENDLHHTGSEQKRALWVAAFSLLRLWFCPSSPHFLTCFVSLVLLVDMRTQICLVNQWRGISNHLLQRSRKWKRTNCELDDLNSCHNISRPGSLKCCIFYGHQALLPYRSLPKDLGQLFSLDLWDTPAGLLELWNHTLK